MANVADERGLSTAVGYALNIAVATILLTTLLTAAGGLVNDQRERVIEEELRVAGERLAGDVQAADRLAAHATTARVVSKLPARVGGTDYRIAVEEPTDSDAPSELRLTASEYDVSVSVPVRTDVTLTETGGTVGGGDVVVVLADSGELEVRDA